MLEELNPDVVEPILNKLANYLEKSQLAIIQKKISNFDFDSAKQQIQILINYYQQIQYKDIN